ncbi:Putative B-block binding subunit of TFIIIC, tfc3, extended winged-helix domain-containing protein [Septoria linicola]|uniref:B-block binding subunit of TFIIIC, tfc3, extended winged-helix domain-containing protein n=1 Tax=Septoria linicola TaxID=215465 RepID=A0A9Q9APY3_9PEZI|nr:putative B-block binding subunit of TFIIIC, tfc3, extended winged-helix domain-containing protein [Septoria linicola]USW49926.1 Putative B-block binding subunit of TFIIIC, tfc3, extended winged-helix domain-containing protein [Septoria linicola]
MAGFDELIERLLYDVALSGSQGFDASRFERAVRAYYQEQNENGEHREDGPKDSLFTDAPPVEKTAVDDKLLSTVLEWLCRHPDVEICRANPDDDLDIPGKKVQTETTTSAIALKLADKRLFTTDDRIWHAIAGHGPDLRRIPQLEFDILSIVAAHSSTGVLQPTITKLTGQDKRSVPKRTDNLQIKGYITKETVIGSTGKTSLLKLKRFSTIQSLEKAPDEAAINNLKPVIHYDKMYNTMMRMLKDNNDIVTMADLRLGLGIHVAQRWETKILARCVRRLADGGCIRRVTAKMADREGEAMTRIGQPMWRKAKAIQLMRPPTEYDRLLWEQSDPNLKATVSDDEEEQEDATGNADAAHLSDNEDGLVEVGAVEEVGSGEQQKQNPEQDDTAVEADDDLNDLDRLTDRIPPHWTPNVPLVNLLYNKINEFGDHGISSTQLQAAVVGPLWKRPMDESLAHLTDIWQHSQPPHLRHLTVVRDTAVFGRSAQFKYRTLANFEKAVAAGRAVWDAVLDNTSSKAKKDPLQEKPDLDKWGFPKVPLKALHGRDGRGSLADGRKGIQIERMVAAEVDEDDVVAEDDEDVVATPVKPNPTTAAAKKAPGRKRGGAAQLEPTRSVPSTTNKPPRSHNGQSINGKRLGRPRKVDRQDTEVGDRDASTRTPQGPYSMRKRLSSNFITQTESDDAGDDLAVDIEDAEESDAVQPDQLRRRPVTDEGYIPQHKPRKIKEEEYVEYDAFATRTAKNRVRLELHASRKRSAVEAGLSNANGMSKMPRVDSDAVQRDTINDIPSTGQLPIATAELPLDRVEHLKAEILQLSKPGLYINPPGAKNAKAETFISRGRPRNAKIAVFKSARLNELAWFIDEERPRFAPPKPLGRKRTATVGKVLKISHDIIVDSDSDAGGPAAKRQKRAIDLETPEVDLTTLGSAPVERGIDDETSDPDGDSAVSATQSVVHYTLSNGEDLGHSTVEQQPRVALLTSESVDIFDTAAKPTHVAEQQVITVPGAAEVARSVDQKPPLEIITPGIASQEPRDRSEQVEALARVPTATPTPDVNEDLARKPPSRTKTTDTTSFYLSRFAPEHRATPTQQYKLLTAKPGRKSKRDLEILAGLEAIIGPQPREPYAVHRLKPTEIPDAGLLAGTPIDMRPLVPTSTPGSRPLSKTMPSQIGLQAHGAPDDSSSVPHSKPAHFQSSAILSATKTNGIGTPNKATRHAGRDALPAPTAQEESSEESSDNSDTDNEDWTLSRLPAGARPTAAVAARTPQLSLHQAMQQAVTPQSSSSKSVPQPVPIAKTEYFSTAYVDSHPDETFYHTGGGRWKRGLPPAGNYHRTFRGPGARSSSKPQDLSAPGTSGHNGTLVKLDVPGSSLRAISAGEIRIPVQTAFDPDTNLTSYASEQIMPTPAEPKIARAGFPLIIIRPYQGSNNQTERTVRSSTPTEAVLDTSNDQGEAQTGDQQLLDEDDRDSRADPDAQDLEDPEDATFEGAEEDEMDIDISEQVGVELTEVGPSRALKTTTKKKYGPPRLGGSTQLKRHEIILDAVQKCGGVFPGDSEVWYVLTTAWKKIYDRLPDKHTVERAVEQLMTEKKLKRFRFQFKSKHSAVITKQILADPSLKASDAVVTQMRKKMMKCYPLQYLPAEVEIEDELRESASFKYGRKKSKNGELKLSRNTVTYLKRRYEEFPEDPELVVHQTVDAAAKADREAQAKGFASAQAMRQHMQDLHDESKFRLNEKNKERRRKEQREAELEDAEIAADIAAEEAELLGEGAGEMQLDNYQHDLTAAMQPRPLGSNAKISTEVTFDNVLPKGKASRPVRKTRKPLGSIRAPAPKAARKLWWEDEKRYRDAMAAHLMSPAQTFLPSSGTFGTSGRGVTQQVVNRRAAPGTLTSEQYQRETAQVIAQIKQVQQQAINEAMPVPASAQTAIITLKVPKEKLSAILSSQPVPAPALFDVDDDEDSLYEGAATPSSVAMSPEPEPEPEPPKKKRRRYTSKKKRQAEEDEALQESDDDFVPGAVVDVVEERRASKPPKLKGPGARGIRKGFTTRDRQSHQDFKDVDRLVIAIALISAVAGGINQSKLNWNLIAHALSFRYDGEFLRRRWVHYVRSRKADVEQLRDDIRQPFLEAYQRGDLPTVNFQSSHDTDWPTLFEWVQATVPMKMSVTVDDDPEIPDLLASRHLLDEEFSIAEGHQLFELNKDDYFTTITDQNRRHLAQRYTLGSGLPGEIKPCENSSNNLLLAKSWVRAVAMTKQHRYVAEDAARKIGALGAKALKQVADDMVESKMFLQDKKGRHLPGRNFQIHHEVLVQFRRWPATKETDEHRYLCALAHSWSKINDYFKQTDTLQLIPITSDQDYTVLTNMCAHGMLNLSVMLPETKNEFDAPAPKLSPWGYTGTSYQTKRANQDQLKFPLFYTRTANYKFEHELNTDVPIPLQAPMLESEMGSRIPFWVDIHGNLIDDIWDMCLRSILHLVVFRAGERAITMQQAHNHKLWRWEIDLILEWMEKTGLACRCGPGEDVDGYWNGGWSATEWWYCAFLPEMVKWETPSQGGLIEVD